MIRPSLPVGPAIAALLVALLTSPSVVAEIVFGTAPTHSEAETQRIYRPLLAHLSEAAGEPVVLKTARNFVDYTTQMRQGSYDLLFDGPHFVAWRLRQLGHEPLARLPGQIQVVVATSADAGYSSLEQLAGKRVCAFASPNMLTMAFMSQFDNPSRQPNMVRVQGFGAMFKCLREGRGEAAVLREKVWQKSDQTGLRLLHKLPRTYPERTFSIAKTVPAASREAIRAALLTDAGREAAREVLERFKRDGFVPAPDADYDGLDILLRPVWGFHQ